MKVSIESIRDGLQAQLAGLDRELQAAGAKVAELKATRRKVANAIRAFGDQDAAATKPAPSQAQVKAAVLGLLESNNGAIERAELDDLVAKRVRRDHGCSEMGLALRMREVLASEAFVVVDSLVRRRAK